MEYIDKRQDVKQLIKQVRHGMEMPLYVLFSIIGFIVFFVYFFASLTTDSFINEINNDLIWYDTSGALSQILFFLSLFSGFSMLLISIVIYIVRVYMYYADQISYSVRVSQNNFPELYEKIREYTYLLGLKKEPEVYVRQMNGQLNAYSAWVPGRCFIQLNAEIVDLAYMENKDLDTVAFVLAHEMGHIYLHHVQLIYNILPILVSFVPVIGGLILYPMLSRAREYSCDRVAQILTNGTNERECMMLLGVGRHIYKYTDANSYIEDINQNCSFLGKLFSRVINLFSSHPIMPLRTMAILDPMKRSGKLF